MGNNQQKAQTTGNIDPKATTTKPMTKDSPKQQYAVEKPQTVSSKEWQLWHDAWLSMVMQTATGNKLALAKPDLKAFMGIL